MADGGEPMQLVRLHRRGARGLHGALASTVVVPAEPRASGHASPRMMPPPALGSDGDGLGAPLVTTRVARRGLGAIGLALGALACGTPAEPTDGGPPDAGVVDGGSDAGPDAGTPRWLDDPLAPFPETLSMVGLHTDVPRRTPIARAVPYAPAWPLWSNGSVKMRYLVLPAGEAVEVDDDGWRFPVGTVFFKTFAYEAGPVETRLIRRTTDGWDYAAYLWRDDGADADRLELRGPATPVEVTDEGERFEHEVPNVLECRRCHESNPTVIIGFSELQLADGDDPRLDALAGEGVLIGDVPDDPTTIEAPNTATREVMGYVHGNCVHCHNGGDGPASEFDLRFDVFLESTVGVPTDGSSSPAGHRISPGAPAASVLYRMLTRTDGAAQPMPPIGVQRTDEAAVARVRDWIGSLPEE